MNLHQFQQISFAPFICMSLRCAAVGCDSGACARRWCGAKKELHWTNSLLGRKCPSSSHHNLTSFEFIGDITCIPTPPCTQKFDHFPLGNLIISFSKTLLVLKLTACERLVFRCKVVNGCRMCNVFGRDISFSVQTQSVLLQNRSIGSTTTTPVTEVTENAVAIPHEAQGCCHTFR